MKSTIIKSKLIWIMSVCCALVIYFTGCKQEQYPIATNSTLNAIQYFETNSQFSLFDQVLEKTGYAGFLGAYGAYTVFAPNNDAVMAYLKSKGKTSIDQMNVDTLKAMAQMHIIQDTLSTLNFTDGKLATPTMYGQYITTGASNVGGSTSYTVNKQAKILQPNIHVGNGVIHTIDHVLSAATLTIAQLVANNPKYSIFAQALTATGFYDTLNVIPANNPKRPFLTLIAQTDSVFKAAGINSYADLKTRYSTTGNPKNANDSLYLYVAYRIIPSVQFLGDITSSPSQPTLAPQESIQTQLIDGNVTLNQIVFNDITEIGVKLDRPHGDVSASNGVLQTVLTEFKYKVRTPSPVYYDVADQPEIRKQTAVFRKPGQSVAAFAYGSLSRITWEYVASYAGIGYNVEPAVLGKVYMLYNDELTVPWRAGNSAVPSWLEFTTPLIVKGTYKVWVCYRATSGQGKYVQASVDGQPLSRILNFVGALPSSTASTAVLESQGFKRYINDQPTTNNYCCAQLAGVVTINTTDVHKIRLTCILNASSGVNTSLLDMIQFIPTTMSQTDKVFTRDGQLVPNPFP